VDANLVSALTAYVTQLAPEMILGAMACVLFLGGTFRKDRHLWGGVALASLVAAGVALFFTHPPQYAGAHGREAANFALYSAPIVLDKFSYFIRAVALCGGFVFVLFSWDEAGDEHAAEYHACILLITAGAGLTGAANELVTLFLALELVSIPTYLMLYLPRADAPAQEAAMKYFLLSIFSSALALFGFSYLYGLTGTTNLAAMADAFRNNKEALTGNGLPLVALIMIVAGLGFRITAVPFHFYAPDVYQGTSTGMAALLSFVPKIVGFAALVRVLGFIHLDVVELPTERVYHIVGSAADGQLLGDQVPEQLLWIMAAVSMSLGNVLALLQDNIKRLLAYSSVAHAGYMLIGLAVAPRLLHTSNSMTGGVEAVLFYLVAYGGMTVGAFAVLHYLSMKTTPVEKVDDLAGLSRSHPVAALVMVLFLLSLIGIPLTAGFAGKLFLFGDAMSVPQTVDSAKSLEVSRLFTSLEVSQLFTILALIGMLNAAVGGWYYLRIAVMMYLRETAEPRPKARPGPVLAAIFVCAAVTLALGLYPPLLLDVTQAAAPRPA
jgi:NADH-quinone oxidoreductase subunit N